MRHEIEGRVIRLRAMELADIQWYDNLPITSEYDDFGQQPPFNSVDRWRAEDANRRLDEWVEEIPLSETRGYVKRVLRSYNTYRLLYRSPSSAAATAALTTEGR